MDKGKKKPKKIPESKVCIHCGYPFVEIVDTGHGWTYIACAYCGENPFGQKHSQR